MQTSAAAARQDCLAIKSELMTLPQLFMKEAVLLIKHHKAKTDNGNVCVTMRDVSIE